MEKWYIQYNGESVGPMEKEQIKFYRPTPDMMVCQVGDSQWVKLYTVPELMCLLNEVPPTPPISNEYDNPSDKSKTAAGILAILLGTLGIQYFYLGKVGGGFLTILLTIVTCGLWQIITLIQGIMMLTMSDQEFNAKFVYTDKTFPLF